ncbi:MAG: N-acetylglucosamine-6-phosphate deacetylase [Aquihabitans sp.]
MIALSGARVVTPLGVIPDGWLTVDAERIVGVGSGPPEGRFDAIDLHGAWVVPGFVDLHVHGGGGHSVTNGDPEEAAQAVAFHERHGTTTTLLSLVTAPVDHLVRAVASLADLVERHLRPDGVAGRVAGIHLEGPFLSQVRCGAQDPRWMIDPDPETVERLLQAGRGCIRVVTIAPERSGALAAIQQLRAAQVMPAIGHTDASHDGTLAAFDAGARLVTHLCNAMGPFHHREPGAVGASLDDRRVVCEVIADGHHVHPSVVRTIMAAKGCDGIALITDAIAAAGSGDGEYDLGGQVVVVRNGVARQKTTGALAGSTLTMADAFANVVHWGVSVADASQMASLVPARMLGLADIVGSIEVGKSADLVVLDDALSVIAVVAGGRVVRGAELLSRGAR